MRVRIVGAGVAGLATAVTLAERGVAVEVVERSSALGAGACAWVAGGMLAPWCERESAEEAVVRLAVGSAAWWSQRCRGVAANGTLVVAPPRDGPDLMRFARRTTCHQWLDEAAIGALEPMLTGRFARGLYFPDEGHLDPRQALPDLAARLAELGGTLRFGEDGLAADGPCDAVIDCRGLAARDVLAGLRGVRGEVVLVRSTELSLSRPVRLLHPRFPLYAVPRGDGLFLIGATSIESDWGGAITARSAVELLSAAYALHPAFAEAEVVETGAGVRPAFADNLPRLRRRGHTLYVNGLYRHGFLLAPAVARMAADAAMDPGCVPEIMDDHHDDHCLERATA